jgi:hypothetical protein
MFEQEVAALADLAADRLVLVEQAGGPLRHGGLRSGTSAHDRT